MWIVLLCACLIIAMTGSAASAGDIDRIEGVVTELHAQEFVLATKDRKVVIVDMSELGGITAALATGQSIVAIGTMAPRGGRFHAVRLEAPSAHPAPSTKPKTRPSADQVKLPNT